MAQGLSNKAPPQRNGCERTVITVIIDYQQIYSNGTIVLTEPSQGTHDGTGLGAWVQKLTQDGIDTEAHQMQGKWENLPTASPHPQPNQEVLGSSASGKSTLVHLKVWALTGLHQILHSLPVLL